jgi:hypothetical protein
MVDLPVGTRLAGVDWHAQPNKESDDGTPPPTVIARSSASFANPAGGRFVLIGPGPFEG